MKKPQKEALVPQSKYLKNLTTAAATKLTKKKPNKLSEKKENSITAIILKVSETLNKHLKQKIWKKLIR